eukprot:gene1015-1287_t
MNFGAEVASVIAGGGIFGISYTPSIIQYGTKLYCVHHGYNANGEMWYTSTSNLVNWEADTQVNNPVGNLLPMAYSPALVLYLGSLWSLFNCGSQWQGDLRNIRFNGASWNEDTFVYDNIGGGARVAESPAATVFNNRIYVTFRVAGGVNAGKIAVASTTTGNMNDWTYTFVPNIVLTGSGAFAMASFNGKIYIVFGNTAVDQYKLYCITSTNGINWTTATAISNVQNMSGEKPSLAVNSAGNKLVLAHRHPSNAKLHIATCDTLGVWSNDQVINTSDINQAPSVALFNGKIVIAYTTSADFLLHYVVEL